MEVVMTEETVIYNPQDHPWIEMMDDSADDDALMIRYSLDEIRIN